MDISVVIPVYNSERYLRRCVDSVLNQKDVIEEIILVDDGSVDGSALICDEYALDYTCISVIHIPNSGPSTAKNKGYDVAQGNYVAFVDSDDEVKGNMFSVMLESGYRNNADIICCNYIQVDEAGCISHTECTNKEYILNTEEALKCILIKDKIYSQCWTKIYRRKTMEENQVRNPEGLKTDEDFIYNIQAFACSKTVSVVDSPLYIYTHRTSSLSKDYSNSHINQYIDNRIMRLELVEKIIHEHFPNLQEYSTFHCIFYYNELLGRICQFPVIFRDKRVKKILQYIRKNHEILMKYHNNFGFSMMGVVLIRYSTQILYLYYRRWQSKNR